MAKRTQWIQSVDEARETLAAAHDASQALEDRAPEICTLAPSEWSIESRGMYLVANGLGELAQSIVDVTICAAAKAIFSRDQARFAAMGIPFTTNFQEVSEQIRVHVDKWVAQSKPPFHMAEV